MQPFHLHYSHGGNCVQQGVYVSLDFYSIWAESATPLTYLARFNVAVTYIPVGFIWISHWYKCQSGVVGFRICPSYAPEYRSIRNLLNRRKSFRTTWSYNWHHVFERLVEGMNERMSGHWVRAMAPDFSSNESPELDLKWNLFAIAFFCI